MSPRRQQCEHVLCLWPGWLWAFRILQRVVDAFHRGELAADDTLRCLHHPLEGFAISSGAAAEPGSDAFNGAPVEVG